MIGACHVTPAGYGYMTHTLKGIARGKLAVILEGGYNLDSISKSALAVAKVLVGEPPENTITLRPQAEAIEVVDEVIKIQSKYFKSLRNGIPNGIFEDVYDLPDVEKSNYKLVNIADQSEAIKWKSYSTKKNLSIFQSSVLHLMVKNPHSQRIYRTN